MALRGLLNRAQENKVGVTAMLESGELVEETADIVQTQVIAHRARASLRNRNTVPVYAQREWGSTPAWRENRIVETGLARPPGGDSRYQLEDSSNLFTGIKSGAVNIDPESAARRNMWGIIANVSAILIALGCFWFIGHRANIEADAALLRREAAIEAGQLYDGRVSYGPADQVQTGAPAEEGAQGEEGEGGGAGGVASGGRGGGEGGVGRAESDSVPDPNALGAGTVGEDARGPDGPREPSDP